MFTTVASWWRLVVERMRMARGESRSPNGLRRVPGIFSSVAIRYGVAWRSPNRCRSSLLIFALAGLMIFSPLPAS